MEEFNVEKKKKKRTEKHLNARYVPYWFVALAAIS